MTQENSVIFPGTETVVHFVYASTVSNLDLRKAELILRETESQRRRRYKDVKRLDGVKEGIQPFLNVSEPWLRVVFRDLNASIVLGGDKKEARTQQILIERRIRLSQTGALSCRISARTNMPLSLQQLTSLVRADRDHLKLGQLSDRNQPSEFFHIFVSDVRHVLKDLSAGGLKCSWVDLGDEWDEEDRKWRKNSDPCLVGKYFQFPFVITFIRLRTSRGNSVEAFISSNSSEIAGVLRAVPKSSVSPTFLEQYLEPVANISGDSRFFLTLYPRSCLAIYADGKGHPGEGTVFGVIDTIELLRMRWQSLIIANSLLDRCVRELHYEFKRSSSSPRFNRAALREKLEEIVGLRIDVAEMLEDPITYRRATSHLSELYEAGVERFRISELQNVVVTKLTQVDRLYDNIVELRRTGELELIDRQWNEVRKLRERLRGALK